MAVITGGCPKCMAMGLRILRRRMALPATSSWGIGDSTMASAGYFSSSRHSNGAATSSPSSSPLKSVSMRKWGDTASDTAAS